MKTIHTNQYLQTFFFLKKTLHLSYTRRLGVVNNNNDNDKRAAGVLRMPTQLQLQTGGEHRVILLYGGECAEWNTLTTE